MIIESEIIPYSASCPPGDRVLVLAPHPDDETFGCGGALRLLSDAGKVIKVVFMTSGEIANPGDRGIEEYKSMREREARRAMKVLKVDDYEFMGFPDRDLFSRRGEAYEILSSTVREFRPDTIYSPSPIDLHPDHRATADLALDITGTNDIKLAFYEITTPIRPNLIVDISGVYQAKKKAIREYKSQIKLIDYLNLIDSLNTYRTFTLGKNVDRAEAFWVPDVKDKGVFLSWIGYQSVLE